MKNIWLRTALLCCLASVAHGQDAEKKTEAYRFTDKKLVDVTPVKDQARSGTCWSFSGMGLVESDLLRRGKGECDLSEMWIVRHAYAEKVAKYIRMHGNANLGGGGTLNDVTYIIDRYGIVPEEVYPGLGYGTDRHVHGELDAAVRAYAEAIVKNPNKTLTPSWKKGLDGILDAYLGVCPEKFTYEGKEYTPKSFAEELGIRHDDYVMITSFTHHPFYAPFALEIPDNWNWALSYNVPMEDMARIVDAALEAGYAVNWASDVSEKGFAYNKGFAVVPVTKVEEMSDSEKGKWTALTDEEIKKMTLDLNGMLPEKTITQQMRQEAFDNYETTDDHGILIMGLAEDQNGNRFYKVKNSWGDSGAYHGYFYASVPFLLYKSTGILLHKDALPKDIKNKLGIR
ncbi:C1 family peptidase [uncultured Alistipes sp.]|uniref:aminopeptidase C n=1 Tax=uncultured Alistipes sp. TaxID=538949 RepID=UPI00261B4038|nr:C1 family peptidase [uncultured Alistipes sp.]